MSREEKKKKTKIKQSKENQVVLDNDERKMNKPVKGMPKV